MKEIDKIAFIEIQNKRILGAKSKGKSKFYIPGGKREYGETDEQTLIREVSEELNIDVVPETAEYFGTFSAQSDGAAQGIIVRMTCYKAKYSGTIKASSEIEETRWLNSNDVDIISEVDKKIFAFLKEKGEIE